MSINDILLRRDFPRFVERFVAKIHPRESGCWEWIGARHRKGYGKIVGAQGTQYAHRVAWVLKHGPIPDELMVLHRCDNPRCCNPAHLFLGTHADNMRDMVVKGRGRLIAKWAARLTESEVLAIRVDARTQRDIAAAYGVCQNAVGRIKRGETWKHLAMR